MAEKRDDVLSLESGDEKSFSGFSSGEEEVELSRKGKAPKDPNSKTKAKKSSAPKASTSGVSKKQKKPKNKGFDLNSLSQSDIDQLRNLLGTSQSPAEVSEPQNLTVSFQNDPNEEQDVNLLYCDEDPDQILDLNVPPVPSLQLQDALFQSEQGSVLGFEEHDNHYIIEEDFEWSLPKLKTPERGENISDSLANLIGRACSNLCQTTEIVEKYKVPANCEAMCPPSVNEEIWVDLNKVKKVQSTDKSFKEIQGLVTASMLPVLELSKVVRPFISKAPEMKTLISEILTLIGQVQFNLSLRRRYLMKPFLKGQFQTLCNMKTPISTMLFGDDIQKEIKKCETAVKIGKFIPNFRRTNSFGRGAPRYRSGYQGQIRGSYRGRGRSARYQPYNNQWSQAQLGFGGPYGQFGHQHNGRRKAPSATVTSTTANNPSVAQNMNANLNQ